MNLNQRQTYNSIIEYFKERKWHSFTSRNGSNTLYIYGKKTYGIKKLDDQEVLLASIYKDGNCKYEMYAFI